MILCRGVRTGVSDGVCEAMPSRFVTIGQTAGRARAARLFLSRAEAFEVMGSDFPASTYRMNASLDPTRESLSSLFRENQPWIFARTAWRLYPALAD